jgi:ankyrin repeat protein
MSCLLADAPLVSLLLANNADITQTGFGGNNVLHLAVMGNQSSVLRLLLENLDETSTKDDNATIPALLSLCLQRNDDGLTPLLCVCDSATVTENHEFIDLFVKYAPESLYETVNASLYREYQFDVITDCKSTSTTASTTNTSFHSSPAPVPVSVSTALPQGEGVDALSLALEAGKDGIAERLRMHDATMQRKWQ